MKSASLCFFGMYGIEVTGKTTMSRGLCNENIFSNIGNIESCGTE